ncbi:hypothetical protein QE152_g36237 [Popillia japonica]|uniref:Uncharacterized protein n=1 Tax=Popillia japonica TaxID=7064 RepID=A0AAW1IDV8_POPJA
MPKRRNSRSYDDGDYDNHMTNILDKLTDSISSQTKLLENITRMLNKNDQINANNGQINATSSNENICQQFPSNAVNDNDRAVHIGNDFKIKELVPTFDARFVNSVDYINSIRRVITERHTPPQIYNIIRASLKGDALVGSQ